MCETVKPGPAREPAVYWGNEIWGLLVFGMMNQVKHGFKSLQSENRK
jgi:hypothetical protein